MIRFSIVFLLLVFTAVVGAQSTHTVAKGETLYSISRKYNTTVAAIAKANQVDAETMKIKLGQKLKMPTSTKDKATKAKVVEKIEAPAKPKARDNSKTTAKIAEKVAESNTNNTTHTVAKGETLYSIARKYGLKVNQIKDANDIAEDLKVKVGQKLSIPGKNDDIDRSSKSKMTKVEETKLEKSISKLNRMEEGRESIPSDNSESVVTKKEVTKKEVIVKKEIANPVEDKPVVKIIEPAKTEVPKEIKKVETPKQEVIKEEVKTQEQRVEDKKPVAARETNDEMLKNANVNPDDYEAVYAAYEKSGKKKVVYRGIGSFLKSETMGNQYLALYNYAEMGAILKLSNLMSKQAIYVKVIGKVPSADTQNEIIIKVSGDAASNLKVNEDKFLVEVVGFSGQ